MPISEQLLKILVCPENKNELRLAEPELIHGLNQQIAAGTAKNRAGRAVTEKIDAGLIRADNRYLYPVREDIPVMLIDEAIEVESLLKE